MIGRFRSLGGSLSSASVMQVGPTWQTTNPMQDLGVKVLEDDFTRNLNKTPVIVMQG